MKMSKDELFEKLAEAETDLTSFEPVQPDVVFVTSDRFGRLVAAESIVEVITRYLLHDNKPNITTVKVLMGIPEIILRQSVARIEKGAEE